VRGESRGRLPDSQREQDPEAESSAPHREFIRRLAHSETAGGYQAGGGPRDTPRARLSFQTRQRAGQSEREKLRRVNPRSGCSEKSGRRSWALEPSGTLTRRRRRARAGTPTQNAHDRTRCRGAEPHESGGGSRGSSQSFGENSAGAPKPMKDGHGVSSMCQRPDGTPQSGSLNFSAKPHRGIAEAIERYVQPPTL
jgi:hypothetical protein